MADAALIDWHAVLVFARNTLSCVEIQEGCERTRWAG